MLMDKKNVVLEIYSDTKKEILSFDRLEIARLNQTNQTQRPRVSLVGRF